MITGAIKNKVDKIWLDIFSAGLANPLTVIEQLTYLMFIRSLDAKELENVNGVLDFKNVSFTYDKTKEVLRNVDLHVEKGCKLALVKPRMGNLYGTEGIHYVHP